MSSELLRALDEARDTPFLVDGATGRVVTYAQAARHAGAIAAQLTERGVAPGDRVALSLPNSPEMALLYVAALRAGVVVVPLGTAFGRRELREVLGRARPTLALTSDERPNEALAAIAGELGIAAATVGQEIDAWADAEPADLPSVSDDALASIHFTSGSTGTPRGVGHRVGDFAGNAARYAQATALTAEHRFHNTLPMTYMAGYYNLILLPLSLGASVVIDRAFDARSVLDFWRAPREHGADVLWLVPTIMAMLLKVDRGTAGREYVRDRVRHVASGTAPLDPDLRARFEAEYSTSVHDSYGLSETLLATSSTVEHPAPRGGVGRALPGVDLRIGSASAANGGGSESGPGPVLIRSPDTMIGYLEGCDSGNRPVFSSHGADEWFDTGDIGTLGSDGELRITGREKEIIIRGGVNVSAIEVEHALEGNSGVEHLAVVGIPHEILGEQVAAVVACASTTEFTDVEGALRERANDALDATRRPDVYVAIDEMPLTPTGKVRKGALRDIVVDHLGLPAAAKEFALDAGRETTGDRGVPRVPSFPGGRIVDLTHPVREGMTSFPSPNHPRPEVTVLARHETQGRMTRRLVLGTHTGTHSDAPLHFIPDGLSIDAVGLEPFVGPAAVVDLTPVEPLEEIGADRLAAALDTAPAHPRVLLRFDWSRRFVDLDFYSQSPYLSRDAAQLLLDRGVRALGMDTPSPDDPRLGQGSEEDSPIHHLLLGAGVVMLEYLANLDRLEPGEAFLVALPLPIVGADGAPMRVVAFQS